LTLDTHRFGPEWMGVPGWLPRVVAPGGCLCSCRLVHPGSPFAQNRPGTGGSCALGGFRRRPTGEPLITRGLANEPWISYPHAEEADDATAALKLLHQQAENNAPLAIAFVDLQMPSMESETLGTNIKNAPVINDTILIMFTSIGRRGDAKRISEIDVAAYLTKPMKQSQPDDCLVTVLDNGSGEVGRKQLATRHTIAEDPQLNLKVLLVEDNAANGTEAVAIVHEFPYDLVFMYCQMSEMDGFEATAEIRKWESMNRYSETDNRESGTRLPIMDNDSRISNGELPLTFNKSQFSVIAMTANAIQGDREKCLEAGMNDYLLNPINAKKLQDDAMIKWTQKVTTEELEG
jgi:two-component system, sensor histidine kinase and response regulator